MQCADCQQRPRKRVIGHFFRIELFFDVTLDAHFPHATYVSWARAEPSAIEQV